MKAAKKITTEIHDTDDSKPDWSKARRGPSRYIGRKIALPIEGIRKMVGKTQADVSADSGIPQGEVSKIENRADLDVISIATLRKLVESMGGELELTAVIDGRRVTIQRRPQHE